MGAWSIWLAIDDIVAGKPQRVYEGGKIEGSTMTRRAGTCCRAAAT